MRKLFLALLLTIFLFSAVEAARPDEALADPLLEARARAISHQLRCPVCQGEAIDESSADLAADLRRYVRERVSAGDTDEEVFAALRRRYGDFILLRPPLKSATALLWLGPFAVFLLGGWLVFRRLQPHKGED